ncbi:MAG: hypothetical protein HRT35_24560 [Algicola sp.]|nr:hypothetical protein [Algicola sp.]
MKLKELLIACILTLPFVAFATELKSGAKKVTPSKTNSAQSKTPKTDSLYKFKQTKARCEPYPKCK